MIFSLININTSIWNEIVGTCENYDKLSDSIVRRHSVVFFNILSWCFNNMSSFLTLQSASRLGELIWPRISKRLRAFGLSGGRIILKLLLSLRFRTKLALKPQWKYVYLTLQHSFLLFFRTEISSGLLSTWL